jgi:hypothetical protein
MPLKKETLSQPFNSVNSRSFEDHPGVARPKNQHPFDYNLRSKFLIGGNKFGFGWRRKTFNDFVKSQLSSKSRYQTGDVFVDALERAPAPSNNLVTFYQSVFSDLHRLSLSGFLTI